MKFHPDIKQNPDMKEDIPILWKIWTILAIVMLIGAVFKLDIISLLLTDSESELKYQEPGVIYYNITKFIVCGLAIYGLYLSRHDDGDLTWTSIFSWQFIFLILALIFNPVLPIPFGREIWLIIDLVVISVLISSFFLFRYPKEIILCDNCGVRLEKGYYHNNDGWSVGSEFCIRCASKMARNGELEVDRKIRAIKKKDDDDEDKVKIADSVTDDDFAEENWKGDENAEYQIIQCPNCVTKNRVPVKKLNENPICGKCHTPLMIKSQR